MCANKEIKDKAKKNGIYLWRIAEALNMHDSALSRKLRRELSAEEKEKILTMIDRMVMEKQEVI